jgi:hypothetical protein
MTGSWQPKCRNNFHKNMSMAWKDEQFYGECSGMSWMAWVSVVPELQVEMWFSNKVVVKQKLRFANKCKCKLGCGRKFVVKQLHEIRHSHYVNSISGMSSTQEKYLNGLHTSVSCRKMAMNIDICILHWCWRLPCSWSHTDESMHEQEKSTQ